MSIKTNGGTLTIEGAADGEVITVYNINGTELGNGTSQNGITTINTTLAAGAVAIIKIGYESIKVIMK